MTTLLWLRHDLRVADNPALRAAAARGGPVVPVVVWAPEEEGAFPPGAASRVWLHHGLEALGASLRALGSRLVVRKGPTLGALRSVADETGARVLVFARRYEPAAGARDAAVASALARAGLAVERVGGSLLFEPEALRTRSGGPFRVFSAFWRACLSREEPSEPEPAPATLAAPPLWPSSMTVADLGLLATVHRAAGIRAAWRPGEAGAHAALDRFVERGLAGYVDGRDRPASPGSSRLSPHLHFGELSARQVWHAVRASPLATSRAAERFLAELGWREFAYHLLVHFPRTPQEPLRPAFGAFPWRHDPAALGAWQRGRTGYPLVDAGMRELWATGWMPNRVRMVAASFLVKHLLLPWTAGAAWFWETLVDADLASNTLGWQWAAGCGADAAPYFRIFNPVTQGRRFDPEGAYIRRWVPEAGRLPAEFLHRPWEAPAAVLEAAGVALGETYPRPIVEHAEARARALAALATLTRGRRG